MLGDSRLSEFSSFISGNNPGKDFTTYVRFKRGARISDLELLLPQVDRDIGYESRRLKIFFICAGINNFTTLRYNNEGEREVLLDPAATVQQAIQHLKDLKQTIIQNFSGSYVILCTVAPADLLTYNVQKREEGLITSPSVSRCTLWNQTDQLMSEIAELNQAIILENFKPQRVFQKMRTVSFHNKCVVLKKTDTGSKVHQFIPSSMRDGLHPTIETANKWFDRCEQCAGIIIDSIVKESSTC